MKTGKLKRFAALFLTLVMIVSAVPQAVWAAAAPVADLPLIGAMERRIYQRSDKNTASIQINGYTAAGPAEARLVNGNAPLTEWLPLIGGSCSFADIPAGGWYSIQARLKDTPDQIETVVSKVGVGDVFLVTGQSNAGCFADVKMAAQQDTVVTFNPGDGRWYPCRDLQPSISTYLTHNNTGNTKFGSCWPITGDLLAETLQVPVGFVVSAFGGASCLSFTTEGDPNGNLSKENYPLIKRSIDALKETGFKAILWHQGETDALKGVATPAALYQERLNSIIAQSRKDAGFDVPWIVANTSYHTMASKETMAQVRLGQQQVCAPADDRTYLGPDTDKLGPELRSTQGGVHFNEQGQIRHGTMWAESVLDLLYGMKLPERDENPLYGKPVTQSSTDSSFSAGKAVDGLAASSSKTQVEASPWWQVDLGSSWDVGVITVDGLPAQADHMIQVLDAKKNVVWESRQLFGGKVAVSADGIPGRYVRIQANTTCALELNEVTVAPAENIAPKGTATQSSTAGNNVNKFGPQKAIDGDRRGDSNTLSFSNTNADPQAWWLLELPEKTPISYIHLYGRTGAPVAEKKMQNFYVSVLDENKNVVWEFFQEQHPQYELLFTPNGAVGKYIRFQHRDAKEMILPEVEVFASTVSCESLTVTASNTGDGSDVKALTDGSDKTFWSTAEMEKASATLDFDLGRSCVLQKLLLTPEQYEGVSHYSNMPLMFNLLVSQDGKSYREAIHQGKITYADFNDNGIKNVNLRGLQARYVRLEITAPAGTMPNGKQMLSLAEAAFVTGGAVPEDEQTDITTVDVLKNSILKGSELPEDLKFFHLRSDLTNSYRKMKNGEPTTIAYVGGSITKMTGWVEKTTDFLKQSFPENKKLNFIKSGHGSMDSTAHAFRLDRDVLSQGKVDLLFLEAAVNDELNNRTEEDIRLSFEGMIQQARRSNPDMDIVLLYFIDDRKINEFKQTGESHIINIQDDVAAYYQIPAIDLSRHVNECMQRGEFTWKDFGGLHPNDFGHTIYTTRISELFSAYWAAAEEKNLQPTTKPTPEVRLDHAYSYGTDRDVQEALDAGMLKLDGFTADPKWNPNDNCEKRPGFVDVPMLVGTKAGDSFTYTFTGSAIGLFTASGPQSGRLEYTIDDGPAKQINLYTQWSHYLHIPWANMLANDLEYTNHTLKVKILDDPTNGRTGCVIRFLMTNDHVTAHDHDFAPDWQFDAESHWHACTICGQKQDEAPHAWVENPQGKLVCSVCGAAQKDFVEKLTYTQDMEKPLNGGEITAVGEAWGLDGKYLKLTRMNEDEWGVRIKLADLENQMDGTYEAAFRTGEQPLGSIGFLARYQDEDNFAGVTIDFNRSWVLHYSKGLNARGNVNLTKQGPALKPNTAYRIKLVCKGDQITTFFMEQGDTQYTELCTMTASGSTATQPGGLAIRVNQSPDPNYPGRVVYLDNVKQYDADGKLIKSLDFEDGKLPAVEVRKNKHNDVNNADAKLELLTAPNGDKVTGFTEDTLNKLSHDGLFLDLNSPMTAEGMYKVRVNGTGAPFGLVFRFKDADNYAAIRYDGGKWIADGKKAGQPVLVDLSDAKIPAPLPGKACDYALTYGEDGYVLQVQPVDGQMTSHTLDGLDVLFQGRGHIGLLADKGAVPVYANALTLTYPEVQPDPPTPGDQSDFFDTDKLDMWYDKPSFDNSDPSRRGMHNWQTQAMPLGNGHMGALIYGGVKTEEMNLNEKTLWQGGPGTKQPGETDNDIYGNWTHTPEGLAQIREMLNHQMEVPTGTAQQMLTNPDSRLFREKHGSYQPMADLAFVMDHGENATGYIRGLDLDTGTSIVEYTVDGVTYQRETFMNYPSNVMVSKLSADASGKVGLTLKLGSRQPKDYTVSADEKTATITLAGSLPDWKHNENGNALLHGNGMKYEVQVRLIPVGGTVTLGQDNSLVVSGADSVMVLMTSGTDYVQDYNKQYKGADPHEKVSAALNAASALGFDKLRTQHYEDFCGIYSRVDLDLNQKKPTEPTDVVLAKYPGGNDPAVNRYLDILAFDVGRYLLLSSSRAGSLPANLQGVWNALISPQWESDYHLNINLQMNYWMSDVLNMPEVLVPMTDYMKDVQKAGTVTAQNIYGLKDGSWIMHNPMNPFGHTGLQFYQNGFWFPEATAWTLRQLTEHYAFTKDAAYLDEIYPMMETNTLFWKNYLVPDQKDGSLICSPTCLPEQAPFTQAGSMSQQIILDMFENYLDMSRDHSKTSTDLYQWVTDNIGKVDNGLRVDEELGVIRDWKYKPSQRGSNFRHLNQAYALYPSDDLVFEDSADSDMMKAAKTFLTVRKPSTVAWSLAWRAALQARMTEGDLAYDALVRCLDGYYAPNFFSFSSMFQIDANLGFSAAMAEMLLQSHAGYVDVLPALPQAWADGSYQGFVARGNFLVDVTWKDHVYDTITVTSRSGETLSLKLEDMDSAAVTVNGKAAQFTANDKIDGVYDLDTKAGDEIVIKRSAAVKAAPTDVKVERMGDKLTFTCAPVAGADSYLVYRYQGGRYEKMGTFNTNSGEFADKFFQKDGVTEHTSTQYVVSAVVDGVETQFSGYAIPDVVEAPTPEEPKALLGHWSFNNANDRGANAVKNGAKALFGSQITFTKGIDGDAVVFTGANDTRDSVMYALVPVVAKGKDVAATDFSISLWVKRADAGMGAQTDSTLIQLVNTADKENTGGSTKPPLQLSPDFTYNTSLRGMSEKLTAKSASNTWQHLVLVNDSKAQTFTLYLNGEKVHTITDFTPASEMGELGLMFGQHRNNQRGFKGAMDEIYCYRGVLTEAEVKELAQVKPAVDTKPLDDAIAAAEEAKEGVLVTDKSAGEVDKGVRFVSPATAKGLDDMIAQAEDARDKAQSDQVVKVVADALNSATADYKSKIQVGTYEKPLNTKPLDDAIAAAEKAREGILVTDKSADEVDKDVRFVSVKADKALNSAITKGKEAREQAHSDEIVQMVADALNKATANYKASIQVGTYVKPAPLPEIHFTDVAEQDWFYPYVKYVCGHDLMSGISGNRFGPSIQLTRSMAVQVLYSMAGKPAVKGEAQFSDVPANEWYTKAVAWAAETGVSSGIGGGKFGPELTITREQLAMMLWSFAEKPAVDETELNFADAENISVWAVKGVSWACENGIMSGVGGNLFAPQAVATRAEAAVMLMRFHEGLAQ